ncbi:MAG TPA: PP2C family serine/threonine-protein phosphatase [Steroidobacteraceae bacterium]|nr:PP2C family serine/threonine-protein phosphatase [Steroidobacteraceae bacterium]
MSSPVTPAALPRGAQAVGASVRGVAHVRDGLPNQDAFAVWQAEGSERRCIVVAVADGHGGARHFRSANGSNFAVNAAVQAMRRIASEWESGDCARQSQIASAVLPEAIVADWTQKVQLHLQSTPITEAEWRALEASSGPEAREQVQAEPALAYGATLLAALVTSTAVLLLQIGDGDAILVGPDGKAWRPIPDDERLTGEFTTSICRAGAQADFRNSIVRFGASPVSLVMLSTDGYSNSFRTDEDFLRVGTDVLQMVRTDGAAAVENQMPQILEHASSNGSGDDITVGLVHLGEADHPVGTAAGSVRPSELRAELATLRRQLRGFRTALIAVGVVALVALAWTFRAQIAALAAKPSGASMPKLAPLKPKPGEVSDIGSESIPSAVLSISAKHAADAVKITATVTLGEPTDTQCTVRESLSAPGFPNLGSASKSLDFSSASDKRTLQVEAATIALPKDPKERKALQAADAKAAVELSCSGKKVASATSHIES